MLLSLLLACADGPAPDDEPAGDAPAAIPAEDRCSEVYTIPGAFGTTLSDAVDPHQDVYGADEPLGPPDGPTVGPTPRHVRLGWPGRDTSRSVSFSWSTDRGTLASVVEWGPEGSTPTRSEGVSYGYGGVDQHQYRVHELKLCDRLEPGTTYTYRVGGDGAWSPWYTFRTPGAPGTFDTFVVAIAGDTRGAYEDWARVMDGMAAWDPDLYLVSGDMVQAGSNQTEWDAWWEATGDRFAQAFLVPAHGNHELLASAWFAQFSLPNNEQWFAFDYGPMTLAVLNDTVSDATHLDVEQAAFLRRTIGGSSAPWKLALHHQSTWSVCTRHGSYEELRAVWEPEFDAAGTDLVIAGHNHVYERSVPIRGSAEATPTTGTTYLVSGGGGAPLYNEIEPDWFNAVNHVAMHYIIGEFSASEAVFTVRDLDGNILDSFTLPVSP